MVRRMSTWNEESDSIKGKERSRDVKLKLYGAKKHEGMADFGFPIFWFWVQALDSLLNKRQVNESVNISEGLM